MDLTQIKIPDTSTLRRIQAISTLSEDHLIALANQLNISTARKKEILIKAGSTEKTSLYIVKGKVSLSAQDGKTKTLVVDESQELRPIAQLRPCIYDVRALGPVTYMKIDAQKIIDFTHLSGVAASDISVHSLFNDDGGEDNSVVNHLYRNLMDNSIKLPSLPSVAERVQQIYSGESTDLEAMVKILVSYPDISRKIKNIARCPRGSDLSATEKIRYSVGQLGMLPLYCVVMTYAVGKLVSRLPKPHMQRVSSFWTHSLNVAAISRILAKTTKSFPPDLAMLAGLLHGIGILVIDDRLLEHHHLMLDHLEIDHAIQAMRPEISGLLLQKWKFDNDIIRVAEECGNWSRDKTGSVELCDLILVANYLGLMQSDRNHSLPHVDSIPAMAKLGIPPETSILAIKESVVARKNIEKLFI